jgi:hypothetical protein
MLQGVTNAGLSARGSLRTDFDKRLSLMQELRSHNPAIRTVDARNRFEDVTKELSNLILLTLSERAGASVGAVRDADQSGVA